jgi:CheY-like chemotaxis protein
VTAAHVAVYRAAGGTAGGSSVPDKITVALFNSNSEVLELLREALQVSGYAAVIAHVEEVKRGRLDMIQFVEEHQPEVIVYDVAPPYDSNWTFLRLMMSSDVMRGRAFVVTTTNKRVLEEIIGPTDILELVGKPFDLEQITDAVTRALETQRKKAASSK